MNKNNRKSKNKGLYIHNASNAQPWKHNYFTKLIETQKEYEGKPGVYSFSVFHDNWCNIYSGGYCNCDPEIKVTEL